MTKYSNFTDDQLLDILGSALAKVDPVPAAVIANAKSAREWADIDFELAALTYDSLVDSAGVRGAGSGRQLNFEVEDTEIVVLATDRDGTFSIEGQLIPAQLGLIDLVHSGSSTSTEIRDLGRFSFTGVPGGRIRLRVTSIPLITEHFSL
ncbi:MAG: hypothetical protein ABJD68_11095 [Nakamurella sp.]